MTEIFFTLELLLCWAMRRFHLAIKGIVMVIFYERSVCGKKPVPRALIILRLPFMSISNGCMEQ